MAKDIKKITDLREFALETLEDLRAGKIEIAEAGVTAKLCETVISTTKAQMEYFRMTQQENEIIPFMESDHSNRVIEGENENKKYLEIKDFKSPFKK